ncbi:MAG TPA: hypothetical protein VKY74_21515 [Chloroflexia bacterium]|nr:hypothetical protein [Chloroflexia bacterium]
MHTYYYNITVTTELLSKRKTLTLTAKAAALLPKLAGIRDQGNYVSQLIEAAAIDHERRVTIAQADLPVLRHLVATLTLELATVKAQVQELNELKLYLQQTQGRRLNPKRKPAAKPPRANPVSTR